MTSTSISYAAGRHAWLDGAPMPPMPPDDAPEHELMFFLGYMREVARDYVMRQQIALYPDRVEPRP